ncbi:MAG TPA: hypothetical protein VLA78_00325 [Paracoccaceae bacterium]|nr:hypothetical protein [Paracoccaceae bacterium]
MPPRKGPKFSHRRVPAARGDTGQTEARVQAMGISQPTAPQGLVARHMAPARSDAGGRSAATAARLTAHRFPAKSERSVTRLHVQGPGVWRATMGRV